MNVDLVDITLPGCVGRGVPLGIGDRDDDIIDAEIMDDGDEPTGP